MTVEPDYKKSLEYYKHLSLFWTDIVYLMASKPAALTSAGPMRKFAMQAKKLATEMIEANEDLTEFNTRLAEYYRSEERRVGKECRL